MDIVAKSKAFQQLKSDLRCGKRMLLAGIDAGKDSSKSCLYSIDTDVLVRAYHVTHTRAGFDAFIEKIERLKKSHGLADAVIGFEPTGTYHRVFAEYLSNRGYTVVYVSSVAVKNNRKTLAGGRWGKNDPRDAFNVVDLLRQGKVQFYRDRDTRAADIRGYLSMHRKLTRAKTALKTRVRNNIWACYFPELDDIFRNIEDPDVLTLLEQFRSPAQIRALGYAAFIGRFGAIRPAQKRRIERLERVWQSAQVSIGCDLPSSATLEAFGIARDIRTIQEDLEHINEQLVSYANEPGPFVQLFTVPGFGAFVIAVFKACVDDIKAFCHHRQLTRLAGIDVESMSSGRFSGTERISKKGMSLLRYALCFATTVAVSRNKRMRQIFESKLQAIGPSRANRAKLKMKFAEKLLRSVFYVLTNNVPFDINRFNVPVNDPV